MIREKSLISALLLLLMIAVGGFAQDQEAEQVPSTPEELQLNAYLESFDKVNLDGKIQILQTAQQDPINQVYPLYKKGLEFVISNSETLQQDTLLQRIAATVVPRLKEAGNPEVAPRIWILFTSSNTNSLRLTVLDTISSFDQPGAEVVSRMVVFLQNMIITTTAGEVVNLQIAGGLVQALSEIGDPAAGEVLVQVIIARLDQNISSQAFRGLADMDEDLVTLFDQAFTRAGSEKKPEIYQVFMDSDIPTEEQKTRFAAAVLRNTLRVQTANQDVRASNELLRQRAVRVIAQNPTAEVTGALIDHFNSTIVAFDRGYGNKSLVLEAIGALGKTNQPEAARRLTEFLELINTYTEQDRPYDRQIALAVIENLKLLGNVESYNALFMVTILNYPSTVKAAAREAIRAVAQ